MFETKCNSCSKNYFSWEEIVIRGKLHYCTHSLAAKVFHAWVEWGLNILKTGIKNCRLVTNGWVCWQHTQHHRLHPQVSRKTGLTQFNLHQDNKNTKRKYLGEGFFIHLKNLITFLNDIAGPF